MKGSTDFLVLFALALLIGSVIARNNWRMWTKFRAPDAAAAVEPHKAQIQSFSIDKSISNIAKSIVTATVLAYNVPVVHAETLLPESATKAIENVERVVYSLKYIQDDIAQTADASSVVQQIKFLLTNYKLRENVDKSIPTVAKKLQEDARAHGRNAYEDLASVYEYFEDEIDDMTGKKKPSREVLQFADVAVEAARKELKDLIALYPQDVVNEIEIKLKPEFAPASDAK